MIEDKEIVKKKVVKKTAVDGRKEGRKVKVWKEMELIYITLSLSLSLSLSQFLCSDRVISGHFIVCIPDEREGGMEGERDGREKERGMGGRMGVREREGRERIVGL